MLKKCTAGSPAHWIESRHRWSVKTIIWRALNLLNIVTGVVYLAFRCTSTITLQCHWLMVVLQIGFLLLEFQTYVQVWLRVAETWNPIKRKSVDLNELPLQYLETFPGDESPGVESSDLPSINIYIPCYREDLKLVENTMKAAIAVDYPETLLSVYLCDDGRDASKKEMVESLKKEITDRQKRTKIGYITRSDNQNAKAGNLNNALQQTHSDLLIILDADFIAYPNLINGMLPFYYNWDPKRTQYLVDHKLAFVQSPQRFRNLSPFDYDPLDQRSIIFYDYILPCRDYHNASTLIGTNNLISRSALNAVGLFPTHSVTEDSALSLLFHSRGYKGYFVDKTLANGLATDSLHGFLSQRNRYAKGDFQILFSQKGPFTLPGLTLMQRVCYIRMQAGKFSSVVDTLFDFCLLLLFVFSVSPVFVTNPLLFLVFWGLYTVNTVVLEVMLIAGSAGFLKASAANNILDFMFRVKLMISLYNSVFRKKCVKFKVTEKKDTQEAPSIRDTKKNSHQPSKISSTGALYTKNKEQIERTDIKQRSRQSCRTEVLRNLKSTWTSTFSLLIYIFAFAWAIRFPPVPKKFYYEKSQGERESDLFLIIIAMGYGLNTTIGLLISVYICFQKFLYPFNPAFLNGNYTRFDHFIQSQKTGGWKVPWSPIGLFQVVRLSLFFGSILCFGLYILGMSGYKIYVIVSPS